MPICKPKPTTDLDLNSSATNDWTFCKIVDATDSPAGIRHCDKCSRAVRCLHILANSQDGSRLGVGRCCAENLTHTYDARAAEQNAKNFAVRRQRFTDLSRWHSSRNNSANILRKVRVPDLGAVTLTVFQSNGRYMIFLAAGKNGKNGKRCLNEHFATQVEAINFAFGLVESLAGP